MQTTFRVSSAAIRQPQRRNARAHPKRNQQSIASTRHSSKQDQMQHAYVQEEWFLCPPIPKSPDLHVTDPYGILPSCGGARDLNEVAQWYYYSDIGVSSKWVTHATVNWGSRFWDFARRSDLVFHHLMLMVLHKQLFIESPTPERIEAFHSHKVQLVSKIRHALQNTDEDDIPSLIVTICGLAMFAVREGDNAACEMHLHAMRALYDRTPLDIGTWLYIGWGDVIMAIILQRPPVLPTREVPPGYKACRAYSAEARRLASKNTREVPVHAILGAQTAFELFTALHELQLVTAERDTADVAPLAELYDFGHRVCHLHAEARADGEASLVEAILITLQLNYLGAIRWWAPLHQDAPKVLLRRLAKLLESRISVPSLRGHIISKSALIWILFTAYTWSSLYLPDLSGTFLADMRSVAVTAKIRKEKDLQATLQNWPAPYASRMAKTEKVWDALQLGQPKQWVKVVDDEVAPSAISGGESVHELRFVAILTFHVNGDI